MARRAWRRRYSIMRRGECGRPGVHGFRGSSLRSLQNWARRSKYYCYVLRAALGAARSTVLRAFHRPRKFKQEPSKVVPSVASNAQQRKMASPRIRKRWKIWKKKRKPLGFKSSEEHLGASASRTLKLCLQKIDSAGVKQTISIQSRGRFLRDPKGALGDWHRSTLYQKLEQHFGNQGKNADGRPHTSSETGSKNLLFVTRHNWHFMQGVIETLDKDQDFEIRTLEVDTLPEACRPTINHFVGSAIRSEVTGENLRLPPLNSNAYCKKLLDWADIIFVEWCDYAAVWTSFYCPPEKRLIVRLHSFEAYAKFPHFVNWANVDVLLTVATHIKTFLLEQIDIEKIGVEMATLPNFNDLRQYDCEKEPIAERTIGMIGYNSANKGPLRALEILRGLVEQHENWRLLLIGDPFPTVPPSTNDQTTRNAFYDYIHEHNLANNVVEHGYTDNVAKANAEIGYILSLSDREGTHEALLQAMAGSSIPVIRSWEVVSQWGAPETVYAKKWIVTSSSEAVSRILDISADEELRKRLAFEAKQEVFSKYDQSDLIPRLKKLLLT